MTWTFGYRMSKKAIQDSDKARYAHHVFINEPTPLHEWPAQKMKWIDIGTSRAYHSFEEYWRGAHGYKFEVNKY